MWREGFQGEGASFIPGIPALKDPPAHSWASFQVRSRSCSFQVQSECPWILEFYNSVINSITFDILYKTPPNLCISWHLGLPKVNDELKKNAHVPKKSSLILTLTKEELKVAPGFPSLNLDRALLVWHKSHFNVLDMSQCRVHRQPRGSFGSRNGLILLQSLGKHRKAWEEMERRILGDTAILGALGWCWIQ